MLKTWRIQRVHILRGCLSDPEISERIMYRYGGTLQLNHVPGEGAKVNIRIPVRGTSPTRPSGSPEPMPPLNCFRHGMTGVARWNYQLLVVLKRPDVVLPAVFDPALMAGSNSSYKRVTGQEKYPTLRVSDRDTGERFGLEYVEPGCPLDWDKHRTQKREDVQEFLATPDVSCAPPLPLRAYPSSARVGPIKTGGRVFVLDHTRWTPPMKEAIDELLQKHRGDKEMLRLVDHEYAAIVHRAAADPNSLLHPTSRLHISRYVKHLVKLLNTSSSLNISPEKLRDTQQLWHSLTEGSESSHVPVVTVEPATFNPPASALSSPLTQHSGKNRRGHFEQTAAVAAAPTRAKEKTKTCLSCGQPKSQCETDGSSIHFFYQQGPVRYFYCSQKVHQSYAAEGLSNPNMSFEDFSTTDFFQRELDATKTRVQEKTEKKRQRTESAPAGRLCSRFCHMELKQGPNSPHIHTGFPGVAGKYIYCPSKVFALYQSQGMVKEMSWKEFSKSPFYEAEKQRWVEEKNK
uniref:Uncharacterized protein n=4 Tax=Nothobranchius TaxID=28779 RepID=A0A1A8R349_9TELE